MKQVGGLNGSVAGVTQRVLVVVVHVKAVLSFFLQASSGARAFCHDA